jgi:hypothetical protein
MSTKFDIRYWRDRVAFCLAQAKGLRAAGDEAGAVAFERTAETAREILAEHERAAA